MRDARLHDAGTRPAAMLLSYYWARPLGPSWMGWSQVSMTTCYQHVTRTDRSIANQVRELFWADDGGRADEPNGGQHSRP